MLERLVHKADFERLLVSRSRLRSAHFAVYHLAEAPATPKKPARVLAAAKLSTASTVDVKQCVDNLPTGHWLGCVVPKRQARRSVTRSLIKRQMRSAFERHLAGLPAGLWLLRLSQGFAVADFVSAQSVALATALRGELDGLLTTCQQRSAAAIFAAGARRQPALASPAGPAAC